MNLLDALPNPVTLVGLDLAWGEKRPDGICLLRFPEGVASPSFEIEVDLIRGDDTLSSFLEEKVKDELLFVAMDAPTIIPNPTGSRPVDRECSRLFREQEAGCHPVNQKLCPRPLRIANRFEKEGFHLSADLARGPRLLAEVYPHPAMIRLFEISKTIKYKKGRVADRRKEYRRYQDFLRGFLQTHLPSFVVSPVIEDLLSASWTKGEEDQLDSFFCSLIGWWHLRYAGSQSQILGDEKTGSILIPNPLTNPDSPT